LQRRLPKRGFKSLATPYKAEVRLSDLERLLVGEVDILTLKQAGVISDLARVVRVILSGDLTKKMSLKGLIVTKGAKVAIEAVGGSVA
jgi:large subunit ribosomal protein L15